MSAEYVKITPSEMMFGESNLLQTQLGLLTILKQYQEYEILRKEEFFLKIELKKKLGEAKEFLDSLSKSLPESKFIEEQEKKDKMQRELTEKIDKAVQNAGKKEERYWKEKQTKQPDNTDKVSASSLDQELEEIRMKLERLQ